MRGPPRAAAGFWGRCRQEGAAGVSHGRGVRAGNPKVGVVGWAGRAARPRGLTAAREVCRPCPQAATGDRLGTPSADCLQLPGSREAGIAPHAPCGVCVSSEKVFASLPQVERGVSKILGGDPKGDNFLYTNGKCVILRNIDNPAVADIYTEHAHQVVVAKYAPSGFYIASGDISGKLRIWDTTQKEHILKYEYQPFAGKIKDIAWTEDSKRIAVVGEGREK